MADDLSREFKRLMRRSTQGETRAPWWVNWLLQAVLLAGVVVGGAWTIDLVRTAWLGLPAVALCSLAGLIDLRGLLPFVHPLGLLMAVGGMVAFIVGARATGIAWLLAGALIGSLPDFIGVDLMAGTMGCG